MKYLIVFALVIFAACNLQAELTKEGLLQIKLDCKNELGITLAALQELRNDVITSSNIQCLIDCTYRRAGVLDSDRRINKPVAREYVILANLTTTDVSGLIDTCAAITVNNDGCLAATQYRQCMKNLLT